MISAIFIHFQATLRKSSLTACIFLRALANYFFKSNTKNKRKKWRYVYRKFGVTQRFDIKDTKERNQIRLMEVKNVPYGETL